MPKVIIINIPMMYHCVLYVQSMSLISAASTAFILCIPMFVTKAFNLDCPYIMHIIISVIIRVISAAVNISTSARKLIETIEILNSLLVCQVLICSYQGYSFYFHTELPNLAVFLEHLSNLD